MDIMDIMNFMDIMDVLDIMDIIDIMEFIDIMKIMNITAWMAKAGVASALNNKLVEMKIINILC